MKLTLIRRIVVGAVLMLAASSFANADTIFYEVDVFLPPGTEHSTAESDLFYPQDVLVPQFNLAGKTLTSVQLFLAYSVTPTIEVYNKDTTATHSFSSASASVPLTLTGPGLSADVTVSYGPIASGTSTPTEAWQGGVGVIASIPKMDVPIAKGFDFGHNFYTSAPITGSISSAVLLGPLGAYIGSGTFLSVVSSSEEGGSFAGTGSTKLIFGGSATAGGKVGVLYTYTDSAVVPEPMTMMMVGSAVLGLGVMMRRRKNKKA